MEELDLLKKDWKRQENSFRQIPEDEIYRMLHQKSSSIVKWILIISILELLFWGVMGFAYSIEDYLKTLSQEHLLIYFKILEWATLAVTVIFIYSFYKNYVRISTTASTRTLMQSILRTRKVVQYYVYYNLTVIVLSVVTGIALEFMYDPEIDVLQEQMSNSMSTMVVTLLILFIFVALAVGVFWLLYRILYGILLKRLFVNYKELKKIDN